MTRERPTLQTVASLHGLLLAWETDEGVIEARYDYAVPLRDAPARDGVVSLRCAIISDRDCEALLELGGLRGIRASLNDTLITDGSPRIEPFGCTWPVAPRAGVNELRLEVTLAEVNPRFMAHLIAPDRLPLGDRAGRRAALRGRARGGRVGAADQRDGRRDGPRDLTEVRPLRARAGDRAGGRAAQPHPQPAPEVAGGLSSVSCAGAFSRCRCGPDALAGELFASAMTERPPRGARGPQQLPLTTTTAPAPLWRRLPACGRVVCRDGLPARHVRARAPVPRGRRWLAGWKPAATNGSRHDERRTGGDARATERHGRRRDACDLAALRLQQFGINLIGGQVRDLMACVNLLSDQPAVDPARIGATGISYGGRLTMYLSALDQRIACAVASGALNIFRERLTIDASCAAQLVPGMLALGDTPEVFGLISPRPLLLEVGTVDGTSPEIFAMDAYSQVGRIYEAAGVRDRLDLDVFEAGHRHNGAKAFGWFDRWLLH